MQATFDSFDPVTRQGRIRGGTYLVQEIAIPPHPELPDTVEPDTAVPYPVNPEALPTY